MSGRFINKILVLDDDAFVLKMTSRILEGLGCTSVTTCVSGVAALELLAIPDRCPELILLDLNMPGMDGVEFVRHLVDHRYTGSLILMSGESESLLQASEKLVRAHNISVLGRISKPATPEVLDEMLKKFALTYRNSLHSGNNAQREEELRAAIANGELINYYQPKVSVSSGKVEGVEALLRWRSPQDGMVQPYEFLGMAESSGLIHDLTRTILSNAFTQSKAWLDEGLSLRMAVNVSVFNLRSLDFADSVSVLAADAGVPPQNVELEVAESWLPMHDMRATLETLTRLHMKRFRLTIDEFGTGYLTINQLRGLPFDEIKIDRDFVNRIWIDAKARARYEAHLAVAKQLNLKICAVGVENIDDWHILSQTGCDYAQGSFIAKPMPAGELAGWMKAWQLRL